MPIPSGISISYGGFSVGGASSYQLLGPYSIDKSYETFRLTFDVIISATTIAAAAAAGSALEDAFRRRLEDGDTISVASRTYTVGTHILRVSAECAKGTNPEANRGHSRSYTCTITGEMPADQDGGLREIEVLVHALASKQRVVTMRGVYTALGGTTAYDVYTGDIDSRADSYTSLIDSTATWELVDETAQLDRQQSGGQPMPHLCTFSRQYVELIADQAQGSRDDDQIRDHRVVFTDLSSHPGDGKEGVRRMRRVVGTYECAVDSTITTDLKPVFDGKVKEHLKRLFRDEFEPATFALEEARASFDFTGNRISVQFQFFYQPQGAQNVVEVAQSVAYQEARTIDYTPVHGGGEFEAEADVGWSTLERIWSRTVIVIGNETPKRRIGQQPQRGNAELFTDEIGGIRGPDGGSNRAGVVADGWNIVSNTSQVTPQWIGDPDSGEQVAVTILTEKVVERFHQKPRGVPGTGTTTGGGPITPR